MKPKAKIPGYVRERFQIAVLTGEKINLYWSDETDNKAYFGLVNPVNILDGCDGSTYLIAHNENGEEIRIRMDLIGNLPTPLK